jgi:hypothetical protein
MTLTFCYNEIISTQENVIEVNLHQDDNHNGDIYYKIWIEEGTLMYSEDHHPQYIKSIEA